MSPSRIQRRRTKGWRKPEWSVYVGRGTRWGNPYRLVRRGNGWAVQYGDDGAAVGTFATDTEARRYATEAFRVWAEHTVGYAVRARVELRGWNLMCWCPAPAPGEPDHCHAAVLLELANKEAQP
ncbi:DUF4326 domain-containing protein [Streptomyces sp. NPDC057413]|uniref:DUF4326 domain-containing protein n=1 Tax=Streptomyces sp. NPDC057413 TaxID=3346124 RepID=UPI00368A9A55